MLYHGVVGCAMWSTPMYLFFFRFILAHSIFHTVDVFSCLCVRFSAALNFMNNILQLFIAHRDVYCIMFDWIVL